MLLRLKKFFIVFYIILISGCSTQDYNIINIYDIESISIETPDDKYNTLFKESLKRTFKSKYTKNHKLLLKASISFTSVESLSASGITALNRTVASVKYELNDSKSNKLINSGHLKSFPALSSTSDSLYASNESLKHIKERLIVSLSKKLYMHLKIISRKLK